MFAETQLQRRGHPFYPPASLLDTIPRLYETEDQPIGERTVYLHYFGGASDWWLVEYDPDEGLGFGYACLRGDAEMAEWGYVSLPELEAVSAAGGLVIVERDLYWTPTRVSDLRLPGWRSEVPPAVTPQMAPTDPIAPDPFAPAAESTGAAGPRPPGQRSEESGADSSRPSIDRDSERHRSIDGSPADAGGPPTDHQPGPAAGGETNRDPADRGHLKPGDADLRHDEPSDVDVYADPPSRPVSAASSPAGTVATSFAATIDPATSAASPPVAKAVNATASIPGSSRIDDAGLHRRLR